MLTFPFFLSSVISDSVRGLENPLPYSHTNTPTYVRHYPTFYVRHRHKTDRKPSNVYTKLRISIELRSFGLTSTGNRDFKPPRYRGRPRRPRTIFTQVLPEDPLRPIKLK